MWKMLIIVGLAAVSGRMAEVGVGQAPVERFG
jgi:hypothetical protein